MNEEMHHGGTEARSRADTVSILCASVPLWFNPMVRCWIILLFLCGIQIRIGAATFVGPWVPLFKGVDHSVSTNTPGAEFPNRLVIHALRVDLLDPDVRFLTTPRHTNYIARAREIGAVTVSTFLKTHRLQAAINANFFSEGSYYLPAGYPMDLYGLAVSEGVEVSAQDSRSHSATILFDATNRPTVLHTNWPAASLDGVFTAISGNYPLVVAGRNIVPRPSRFDSEPRTAFGISQDQRYLYLVAIDGRQSGYSDGSSDFETAGWMLLLGAYDAVNMDGGGSTTMVIEDTTGAAVRLNRSSAVADSGRERTVGSHFGIYAKPLQGFISDVAALPDDTSARITWKTASPATSEVEYGVTPGLGSVANDPDSSSLKTEHEVQLTGLTAATGYYFRVLSVAESQEHVSSSFYFVTTNYVTTNQVFSITNEWRYLASPPADATWTGRDYDDSAWSGPGPGLLWVDTRAAGPNAAVEPKNTQMPADPGTGFPYVSYYFRARFVLPEVIPGSSLFFSGYLDDGAIFYLNGVEIYRLRMPADSDAQTLASGFGCEGDATCLDEFAVPLSTIPGIVAGENVLAVEVHNYNRRSADITFGFALHRIEPYRRESKLAIEQSSAGLTLIWEGGGLESADALEGPWTAFPATSPVLLEPSQSSRFFRLQR